MEGELFILMCVISHVFSTCSPKGLTFVDFQKTRKRSKPFVLAVTAAGCPEMAGVYYEWRVRQVDGPAVQTANESFITIDGYQYSSDVVFAKPYGVTVWVSHYEDMHASESISDTFQFIPEKIHLEIRGGLARNHPINDPLLIDAESLSRDLSYPRGEEEFEGDAIKCSVTPELAGFEIPNELRFTVPADFLQLNKEYTFTVEVNRTKIPNFADSQKATQVVFVYDPFDRIFGSPSELTRETRKVFNGTCEITPKSGVSAVTLFQINCTGFSTDTGVIKFLIHQKSDWEEYGILLCVSEDPISFTYLLPGSAEIMIRVVDGKDSEFQTKLHVTVEKYKPPGDKSFVHTLKDAILGPFYYSIPSMVKRFEVNKATQMIAAFAVAVKDLKTKILKEEVQVLYKHLAQSCAKLPIFDYDLMMQRVTLVKHLIKYMPFFYSPTNRILAKSLLHAARGLREFFKPRSIPASRNITFLILKSASELILFERDHPPPEKRIPAHEYDSYDDFVDDKVQLADDMDDTAVFAITSIEIATCVDVQALLINEKEMVFDDGYLKIRYGTLWSKDLDAFPCAEAEAKVVFSDDFKKEFKERYLYYDYIIFSLRRNPFWWRRDNHHLLTHVLYFTNALLCKIFEPLKTFFTIEFKKMKPLETYLSTEYNITQDVVIYRFEQTRGETLTLKVEKLEENILVFVDFCCCTDEDIAEASEINGRLYQMVRPRAPVTYLCIARKGNLSLNYNLSAILFKCVYWDPDIANWTTSGMDVGYTFTEDQTTVNCRAHHFSIFAAQGWKVVAEKVDNIKLTFQIAKSEHYIIIIILSVVLLCWLIFLFCAWVKDTRSEVTNLVWALDDNVPGDKHAYLVVVFTGSFIDAGTTADVAIQLLGKRKNSRVHIIKTRGLTVLARDTQDWFILYTPHYLGKVKKIRLWHNCRGKMPHWYCERVLIRHLRSGEQYCFIVEKWFSLIWGDGKICREISVVDECRRDFPKKMFRIWLQRNFQDSHWFLSVFMRDRQSNFTSLERVGVLMVFFYTFMLVSAMTDWIPVFGPEDSIDDKPTFYFDWRDIGMFLLCLVLSTALAVLVLILFRYSAPQHHNLFVRRGKELPCENFT